MRAVLRVLTGAAGVILAIAAVCLLLFSGNCVSEAVGMLGTADSAGLNKLVLIVAVAGVLLSLAAIWLGVRLSRWGFGGPARHDAGTN
ncbi:MAG: hypothetical protein ACM3Q1_13290 [Bacteroidales bacterium]